MASNILLKFADIAGESVQAEFTEWIECQSISFGVSAPLSVVGNQGLGSGKANLSSYNLSTLMGQHSHEVMEKMLNGKHHVTIEVKVLKQTGDETGQPYWTLNGKKGYIESISWHAGPDGVFYENIVFLPEEHTWEYFKQNTEDGTLTSTGAKTYNVKESQTS
jgi:type VI secretion system secreted protein Hcp